MKYKFLYTGGDSFAVGAGLAYYKFFPENPEILKDFSKEDIQKGAHFEITKKIHEQLIPSMKVGYSTMVDCEKSLSYSSIISNRAGIGVLNDSTHGASFTRIYFNAINSLSKIIKNIDAKDILVVIQLTSIFRLMLPFTKTYKDIHVNFSGNINDDEMKIRKHFITHADDMYYALNAKSCLDALVKFLDLHNLDYVFVDSWLYSSSVSTLSENLRKLMPTCDYVISDNYLSTDKIFLSCGHFNSRVHDDVANFIITNYIQ